MIRCLLFFSALLFLYSCKESLPPEIIKPKKMEEILWDIVRAEALSKERANRDSSVILENEKTGLYNEIFLIHNISKEQFDKSYTYYNNHPDIMGTMLDSIHIRHSRIDSSAMQVKPVKTVNNSILRDSSMPVKEVRSRR